MERIRNRHLDGFTLIDFIIAMLLSGILLSLAIKVMLTILSMGSLQSKASSKNNDILSIHRLLCESFRNAIKVESNNNEDLTFYYSNVRPQRILFKTSYVTIGNDLSQDTINLQWENLKIKRLKKDSILIEALSFTVQFNNLSYPFYYKKEYSNQILFNSDN